MTGVAGPMLRSNKANGIRFLIGLTVGGIVAGTVLGVAGHLLGNLAQDLLPVQARLVLLAAIAAVLGVADTLNRTPHLWRQVPQMLVHNLPPGMLGVVWGFDLGLLFTTQKVVSLIWVAVAAVVLLAPELAVAVFIGIALLASLVIAAWSGTGKIRTRPVTRWERQWQRQVRKISGATMLIMVVVTAVQAWSA